MNIKNKNVLPKHLKLKFFLTAKYSITTKRSKAELSGADVNGFKLKVAVPMDVRVPAKETCHSLAKMWLVAHEKKYPKSVWQEYEVYFMGWYPKHGWMVGIACHEQIPTWAIQEA